MGRHAAETSRSMLRRRVRFGGLMLIDACGRRKVCGRDAGALGVGTRRTGGNHSRSRTRRALQSTRVIKYFQSHHVFYVSGLLYSELPKLATLEHRERAASQRTTLQDHENCQRIRTLYPSLFICTSSSHVSGKPPSSLRLLGLYIARDLFAFGLKAISKFLRDLG